MAKLLGSVCRKEPHSPWQVAMIEAQRQVVAHYLAAHGGNKTNAALALGMTRPNFSRLCKALGFVEPTAA